jgi:hypothetical protein
MTHLTDPAYAVVSTQQRRNLARITGAAGLVTSSDSAKVLRAGESRAGTRWGWSRR